MITISEEQLAQVEYLFEQSIQGNHLLFEPESLWRVFRGRPDRTPDRKALSTRQAESVEKHIETLLAEPSLIKKREYLDALDTLTYEWVVRTYFSILENNLFEAQATRH